MGSSLAGIIGSAIRYRIRHPIAPAYACIALHPQHVYYLTEIVMPNDE